MTDRTDLDTSRIPEADFPVHCAQCGHELTGLEETGTCPACGTDFVRRDLLWRDHGPEAFAEPPMTAPENPEATVRSTFVAGLLFGLVLVAALPLGLAIWRLTFGTYNLWGVIFTWLVVAGILEWLFVIRHRGDHL